MAFTFRPAIQRGGDLYELPRPVTVLRILEGWDFEQLKVPLADGDFLAGHSRQGVTISLSGQFGAREGVLSATEEQMFEEWAELREQLDVTQNADKYEFFLYHDAGSGTYRSFRQCSTVRFECDMSSKHLFEYSLIVHAEDPALHR